MPNTRILFVDDEEKILNGIERQQGDDFDISIALGPYPALELVQNEEPFAVVVSDMRMPEMNGVELLAKIREISPDTVRMMLTGYAELSSTIEAVNQGHIFRFLSKPCSADDLAAALNAGLRQYALVEAEKELVEGTLHGSVNVLSEVLSLVNPLAFGQSSRVRATVDGILKRADVENQWQLEIAAMLSPLGCVALSQQILQDKIDGKKLSLEDEKTFAAHPKIAADLLKSIPRLEPVANIIFNQNSHPPKSGGPNISIESQILKMAIDFDQQELICESSLHALNELKDNGQNYDAELFEALSEYVKQERDLQIVKLSPSDIREGMVLAEDLRNDQGTLLMSKGQKITAAAQHVIENLTQNKTLTEPIKVIDAKHSCPVV